LNLALKKVSMKRNIPFILHFGFVYHIKNNCRF